MAILKEGENCWRKTRAGRIGYLIDAADYFEAFAEAVRHARHSIFIAAWDIDSRLQLERRNSKNNQSSSLGEFLNGLADRTPDLNIYILAWDYPMMYLREREWLPVINLGWKTHRRISFHLDDQHPIGASQHQKFVVIDDSIAFCGGIDLTKNRWDTREHLQGDSRRCDANAENYAPFHDVQMIVDGKAAEALGDQFRERWRWATGKKLSGNETGGENCWPSNAAVELKNADIGIARTLPAFKTRQEVREVETLYLNSIQAAEKHIYIENQYLTSDEIRRALEARLGNRDGPEVVLVLPRRASGWLEQLSMDAIRCRIVSQLGEADKYGRFQVYHPVNGTETIYVHAKVLVVDERLAVVGSANLSNRSMGLDSECNLAVESEGRRDGEAAVASLRNGLLAEHLGTKVDDVVRAVSETGSLITTIGSLGSRDRTLKQLDCCQDLTVDGTSIVPDRELLDPEKPLKLDSMMDYFACEPDEGESGNVPLVKIAIFLILLLAMAAAWRWTQLAQWISLQRLATWADLLNDNHILAIGVIAAYAVGGLIMVPITVMVGATAIVLAPIQAVALALMGCVFSAWISYLVGSHLGKNTIRKLAGRRLKRLNKYLASQGLLTVILIRNLPIAPYTIVNIVAGASRINLRDFLAGTAIGMLPGILAITVFADQLLEAFKDPSWGKVLITAGILVIFGIVLWWIQKRIKSKTEKL